MIFVTVGHQMPFDRLVRAVDEWAGRTGRRDLFAQIGESDYVPKHFPAQKFLTPQEFRSRMCQATAVVAHAGTGTIIAALQHRKPLLVLPRISRHGETRNDHQIPTAKHFAEAGYVLAASDEGDLIGRMSLIEVFRPKSGIEGHASQELVSVLREFAFDCSGQNRGLKPVS